MRRISYGLAVVVAAGVVVLCGRAISAQDKYTLKVPNGFACHTTVKTRDYVFTAYAKR